jgi:5-methylcytosine-specific restriction enzyme A
MSTNRRNPNAGWVKKRKKTETTQQLCRRCGDPIVENRRRTFCSDECVHQWRLTSDPAYLRQQVFERDRGVCAGCRLDTQALLRYFPRGWRYYQRIGERQVVSSAEWIELCRALGIPQSRAENASLWDADHIIPVIEGGGECDLSNIRTLCICCHRAATMELRRRMASRKAAQIQTETDS